MDRKIKVAGLGAAAMILGAFQSMKQSAAMEKMEKAAELSAKVKEKDGNYSPSRRERRLSGVNDGFTAGINKWASHKHYTRSDRKKLAKKKRA